MHAPGARSLSLLGFLCVCVSVCIQAPWRVQAQRGRTHAVRVRGVCVGEGVGVWPWLWAPWPRWERPWRGASLL